MSPERSVEAPMSCENCVPVELPRQPILLGPAPFVVRDGAALSLEMIVESAGFERPELWPVTHRYSA